MNSICTGINKEPDHFDWLFFAGLKGGAKQAQFRYQDLSMISIRLSRFLFAVFACLYLQACSTSQVADYPPPGKLVDIGTHRMHIHCTGTGRPTIVLEAGAASAVPNWQAVQGPLSAISRTCSYDRSGLQWSERRKGVISTALVATELHSLLEAAGEPGPYMLVGHSLGGIYARKYIEVYPQDAAGLVLVDSSHPEQNSRMPERFRSPAPGLLGFSSARFITGRLLALTGYDEKMVRQSYVTMPANVTEVTVAYLDHSLPAFIDEVVLAPKLMQEVSSDQNFGALPVVVIAAGRQHDPAYGINARYPADELAAAAQTWRELQTSLLELSSSSRLVVATESGHNINFEQPQIIIDSVERLLAALRGNGQ